MEWTGARYADKPTVQVRTWIEAPPERVWAVEDRTTRPRSGASGPPPREQGPAAS
ncbi:hypothetical protein GCM10023321_63340 [Pseudonocardia eucalypti]|uniref:Uncharacterized protein n=1 Tax=Pseudonocardia eucalypti TaxID=648755 RepID=A0ABP9QWI7_9PSEU|nr:hypothetical protein [Pseudonocardia eucalypti]